MNATRHLIDPELLPLLGMLPSISLSDDLLPHMRESMKLPAPDIDNPDSVAKSVQLVPGRDGAPDVGMVIYRPSAAAVPMGCILHIHGGGYVAGVVGTQEPAHRAMAESLGCMIATVDYRLAPETPYPGPLEDCYAALIWLAANNAALGIDPQRIGVMGESAGGGLAAALALLARDRDEVRLAFQHLIYPMLDDRTCLTGGGNDHAGEFVWTRESNVYGWQSYLGMEPGSEDVPAYAAPARAEKLAGLPPTFISTGGLDLFLEEDIDYARRLMRAGVPVELHVYPGAYHAFDVDPAAGVSQRARRDSLDALSRALSRG